MVPIFIICFNNLFYVRSMYEQLKKYDAKVYIIDNCSTFPPLLDYLNSLENGIVLKQEENYGHKVVYSNFIKELGGEKYIITDPDLLLNPNLPDNFIDILCELSEMYEAQKVGFALDIENNIRKNIFYHGMTIQHWERKYWKTKIKHPIYELYRAPIDTTFCLYNSKYSDKNSVRIAGNFTCVHRPWLNDWENEIPKDELDFYKQTSKCSTWIKK